ncbi:protein GAMETE EXPRESSED 1 [Heracleum sosnowskyi]|uniref:Protein GAMETE EXPRESSED 1 n=1 Tax=Heracleum sosnowskyi TaxID=360622 RepID=A0AAD8HSZ7_9APIA|nr:protein GAMETE EXPRESSED 1 [Heracleum sosnowskyi]
MITRKRAEMERLYFQFLLAVILLLHNNQPVAGWWFSSKEAHGNDQYQEKEAIPKDRVAEFSMEPLNNQKGMKLVENARRMVVSSNSCWQNAYKNLFAGCSEILAGEEMRSRFAWHLSDCFQRDSGRPDFPYCDVKSSMKSCRQKLDENAHKLYLEFFLETNSICHQLQADAFKRQMERLVNELKETAENTETKIENIEQRADELIESSNQIKESLSLVDLRTNQVAHTLKNVGDHVNHVLTNSEAVYELSTGIATSQEELRVGQGRMLETLEEGMIMLHDSHNKLDQDISHLGNKTVEIQSHIIKVGDSMSSKMNILQTTAEDIGNVTEVTLDRQNELLAGQSAAVEGLRTLNDFMSQALHESKVIMQQLAEFGHKQQEELLNRQKQLELAHDHLVENSGRILAAQEAFESKQATMFLAIDKLFALHNAILLESRLIKAFIVYSLAIFLIYMFTSTKQTYSMRPRLYMGLCATFMIEFLLLKFWTNGIDNRGWITNLVRLAFAVLASFQLLYAIYIYRDYETLNHEMLLTLVEKFNVMQKRKELSEDMDSDDEWSAWIDKDLSEDVDKLEDPDFLISEEVGENSIVSSTTTGRYNLRSRHR